MDFLNDQFRRSVGNYKDGANSIAQGAIAGRTGISEAQQGLAEASNQEKAAEGTAEVTSKISQQSTKFMKELGIDMSFKPSIGAASGMLNFGGRTLTEAGKKYAFTGEGRMAQAEGPYSSRALGFHGRMRPDVPEKDQPEDVVNPAPKADMSNAPEAGKFSFTEGQGGIVRTGEAGASSGAGGGASTVTATPVADTTVTATPIADTTVTATPIPPPPPPRAPVADADRGQAPDIGAPSSSTAARASSTARSDQPASINEEMARMRTSGDTVGGDFDQRIGNISTDNPTAGGTAAVSREEGTITQETDEAVQATSDITESVAGTLLDAGGTVLKGIGGFLGDIMPFVGPIMAGVGLYEGFHDLNKQYGDMGNDPYAKVRGQIQAGQQKINAMSNNISADQFASKVGGGTPAFGSLAAPTISSVSQMGQGSGHF